MSTLLAILSALPKLIQLVQFFAAMVHDAEQRGLGRKEAIAEAAEQMHRDLAMAVAEDVMASERHAKIKDDTAFDQDFKRAD